jgi:hypothetical protein
MEPSHNRRQALPCTPSPLPMHTALTNLIATLTATLPTHVTYIYVCVCVCVYVCVCTYVCVCMYECMYVHMHVCMIYIYILYYMYIIYILYTHTHTHTHTYIYTRALTNPLPRENKTTQPILHHPPSPFLLLSLALPTYALAHELAAARSRSLSCCYFAHPQTFENLGEEANTHTQTHTHTHTHTLILYIYMIYIYMYINI